MKKRLNIFSFFLICFSFLIYSSIVILGQDKLNDDAKGTYTSESKYPVKQEINKMNTESSSEVIFYEKATKKPNEPWVDELHNARLNNDHQKMREIESQHSIPLNRNGESFRDPVIRISGTVGHSGEPRFLSGSGNIQSPLDWGNDIHVRYANFTFQESHPAMATASDGTIYIVWENVGQTGSNDYLQIYYSIDGGFNWIAYGFFENPTYNLREPSIAIGEGAQNLLLIAYIVDDGVVPFPEVATTPLYQIGFSWTVHSVPYWNWWQGYREPNIWTDSYDYSSWYAYLTCEGIYSAATNNYNVCFWRTVDYSTTWSTGQVIMGEADSEAWRDPDGTYGTTANKLFVACFNQTDNTLYTRMSNDFGSTWTADTIAIYTMTEIPTHAVDPDIEAAVNYDNVMLCCTKSYDSNDDIGQGYSTDGGYSWTTLWNLNGYTSIDEFAVDLTANEGGNSWHVCYTTATWWVYYNTRPQDLSVYWSSTPQVVNDIDWASASHNKKSITSNWTTDIPGIAWADYRDGSPDYDIYYDSDQAATFQLSVNVSNGWNMVSIPGLHPDDQNVNTWWAFRDPGANVFRYAGGYQPVTAAVPGTGYWMKHAGARTYNTGEEWPAGGIQTIPHDPLAGASGWNLFGGYELSVTAANVTTNPPGLQSGPIYRYSGGYAVATTLDPGYGYWIKLNAAGQIIIPETMAKGEVVEYFTEDWGRIILTDATGINYTLYAVKGETDLTQYELPPAPPAGMFDIRYSSGRIAEDINSSVKTIDMSGITYPLTVRVEGMNIRLMDETGKTLNVNLKHGEDVVIDNSSINKLMVSGEIIPTVYSLEQNYPNPFNPSTVIEFSLPEDVANVKLSIYNTLGEKVAELVNTALLAGKYQYQWNAQNVATGIYIYELRTDNYVSVKKMVLLK